MVQIKRKIAQHEIMHVFIDSNILYEDYFFDNKHPNTILQYAKDGLIFLYMSDIVRLELRRQYQKELEETNKELNKIVDDVTRLKITENIVIIDIDQKLKRFDNFYDDLSDLKNFEILECKNEYLPDIIDRAIYRRKPFTESKTELKDALIWKTYADFVESKKISECILLTNNTNDFCTKNVKDKVHPELLKDTEKFIVINSAFNFVKAYTDELESPELRLRVYMDKLGLNDDLVLQMIKANFEQDINKSISEAIERLSPGSIFDEARFIFDGHVTGYATELLECSNVEYELQSYNALVSGELFVSCETESFQYNPVHDSWEDKYTCLGEANITYKIYFNFDLGVGEQCSQFEITDIILDSVD